MPDWLLPLAALLFMLVAPIFAWWGSTRYFSGRFDEQQRHTLEWRVNIENRLKNLDLTISAQSYAALQVRMQHVEDDLIGLHRWKHVVVDPYLPTAVDVIKERVDRIETRVFSGHRGNER